MKQIGKKLYLVIGMLAVLMVLMLKPVTVQASEKVVVGDWEYYVYDDGTAKVIGYNGSATEVVIPSTVTVEGVEYMVTTISGVFGKSTNVTKITIPKEIVYINSGSFSGCLYLEELIIEGNVTIGDYPYEAFNNIGEKADGLTVVFKEGVTSIPKKMFNTDDVEDAACITKVIIPDTVTTIGANAFYNCIELETIEIGQSVSIIDSNAFYNCAKLEKIEIGKSVNTINYRAFAGCTSLKQLDLGDSAVTTISKEAFLNCTAMETLILPKIKCSLKDGAFGGCTGLTSIIVNSDLADCNSSSASYYSNSNYSAFYNAGSQADSLTVTFTEGVTRVPKYLFATGYSEGNEMSPACVTKVVLANTVETIGDYAFYNCSELETLVMSAGIVDCYSNSFAHNEALQYIALGDASKLALSAGSAESMHPGYAVTAITAKKGDVTVSLEQTRGSGTKEIVLPSSLISAYLSNPGVLKLSQDRTNVFAGMVVETDAETIIEYRWTAHNKTLATTEVVQDWTENNEWLSWDPAIYGEYELIAEARLKFNPDTVVSATSEAFEFNPYIKGKCQMPYYGEGGGYLIGVESYENPNQEYYYEMLILDCTLLAQGKDAWVYTTGLYRVEDGNAGWCIWQPQYGYYWTLFRVYDKDKNMIDQACYGFANAY